MKKNWLYLSNVFANVTRKTFKKMLSLITDHESKLHSASADADIATLLARTTPVKDAFSNTYNLWLTAKGMWEGETMRFENKMDELTDQKIKQWDARVRVVHLEDTPDYKIIFPEGRTGFRTGTYETRIARVGSLNEALKNYISLATLQLEVESFYNEMVNIRDVQQQKELQVKSNSDQLENDRIVAAAIMYSNLGFMMYKYYEDTEKIEKFFDLSLLRSGAAGEGEPEQEVLTGTVATLTSVTILEGGFDANSYFQLTNTGNTSLQFYTAKLPTDPVPGSATELMPGEEANVYASELGAEDNLFLMVYNPDDIQEGEYAFMRNDNTV